MFEYVKQTINQYPPLVDSLPSGYLMKTSLRELLEYEIKKAKSLFLNLNTEIKLVEQSLKRCLDDPLVKEIIDYYNSQSSVSSPEKSVVTPKSNEGKLSFTEKDVQKSLSKIGTRQKIILLKIHSELIKTKTNEVRLSLAEWLGNTSISDSTRATWSKCLSKLIDRKLIVKTFSDRNCLSKGNTGNSKSYVSLTPLGFAAAKWLINNGHVD